MMQIIKQKHAYKNSYLLTFEKKKLCQIIPLPNYNKITIKI